MTEQFEHEAVYWLDFPDGSRVRTVAWVDKHGGVDLRNDQMDFVLWAQGAGNLDGIRVTKDFKETKK